MGGSSGGPQPGGGGRRGQDGGGVQVSLLRILGQNSAARHQPHRGPAHVRPLLLHLRHLLQSLPH